jgi:hypothetical protein
MRAYTASDQEALRARNLLKDWAAEGLLTGEQYQLMEPETVCDLRTTNIFLRLVLFLFTLIVVCAAVSLFFTVFRLQASQSATGAFLLIFAALVYAAAELAVTQARLYRHGIEEALALCSIGLLCAGIQVAFFSSRDYWARPSGLQSLVPSAGVLASLWIWHRFGRRYTFPVATIFAIWLPGCWTSAPWAQHLILASLYAAGLIAVIAVRPRYRFTYLDDAFSVAEASLWLGIYLASNLKLPIPGIAAQFPTPFYWATWALIWCLPPIVLARGLRLKDRFVIWAGGISAILTLIAGKPYLGWPRQTWDPMLLGALLIVTALLLRRRFPRTHKDKAWMNAVSSVSVLLPAPHTVPPEFRFGGGDSTGGGATSDF